MQLGRNFGSRKHKGTWYSAEALIKEHPDGMTHTDKRRRATMEGQEVHDFTAADDHVSSAPSTDGGGGGGGYPEGGAVAATHFTAISKTYAEVATSVLVDYTASKPFGATCSWWGYFSANLKTNLSGIAICNFCVVNGNRRQENIKYGYPPHLREHLYTKKRGTMSFIGSAIAQAVKFTTGQSAMGRAVEQPRIPCDITLLMNSWSRREIFPCVGLYWASTIWSMAMCLGVPYANKWVRIGTAEKS